MTFHSHAWFWGCVQFQIHAKSYTKVLNSLYHNHPVYQYIQINLQENILKSILVNIFLSSLRSKIPPYQHTRYLVSRQSMVCNLTNLANFHTHSVYGHLGVRAGTTGNDQQSHWLRLSCRPKFKNKVGSLCGCEERRGRSPYSLRRCSTQTS